MRQLVLTDRHALAFERRDVYRLQDRIAEKSVRRDLRSERVDLILVRGHPLEPRDGHDHRQENAEPADLRYVRLELDRAFAGVEPRSEPIGDHLADVARD